MSLRMQGRKWTTVSILSVVLSLFVIALVIGRLFFIDYSIVPQDGMYPGLSSGSLLLSWKRPYRSVSDVKRGDVVLFTRSENGVPSKFIWRVVGLPGDKIEMKEDSILLNGRPLNREKVRKDGTMNIYREENGQSYEVAYPEIVTGRVPPPASLMVPENSVFVLGDNRYNALDSRYLGPIPFNSIVGKTF
jgi:signal peptidase I